MAEDLQKAVAVLKLLLRVFSSHHLRVCPPEDPLPNSRLPNPIHYYANASRISAFYRLLISLCGHTFGSLLTSRLRWPSFFSGPDNREYRIAFNARYHITLSMSNSSTAPFTHHTPFFCLRPTHCLKRSFTISFESFREI